MSVPSESLWAKTDVPRASATLNSRLQLRLLRHSSSTDKRSRVVHVGLTSHPTKSQLSVAAVVAASVTVEAVVASEVETVVVSEAVTAVASEVAIVAASEVAIVAASEVASEVEIVVASEVEIAAASEVVTVVVAETSAMLSTRTRATSLLTLARRLPSELSDSGDKAVVKVQ